MFFLWYGVARFGSPLESGYALASLPAFLELQRERGLFSLNHLATNLDYLFIHLPSFFVTQPDGRIQWLIPPLATIRVGTSNPRDQSGVAPRPAVTGARGWRSPSA